MRVILRGFSFYAAQISFNHGTHIPENCQAAR